MVITEVSSSTNHAPAFTAHISLLTVTKVWKHGEQIITPVKMQEHINVHAMKLESHDQH